jgi:hypothetical protein
MVRLSGNALGERGGELTDQVRARSVTERLPARATWPPPDLGNWGP